jgi:RNA polymerase sigma-70 factor (ECF subfamily)
MTREPLRSSGGVVDPMGTPAQKEVTCEVLMARFRAGDPLALATLVGRHKRPLYNFALRLLRSPAAAEDLVQDAFGKVVQRAAELEEGAAFSTFMYGIARGLCADRLRKAMPREDDSLDTPEESGERTTSGERMAVPAQRGQRVARGVEALPVVEREVYLLREVGNLPFKDIAVVTGVPEATVKSRMRQALERLQESIASDEDGRRALR